MAITQVYTAIPNDVITAARWNNEFGNIYNNGTALAFPTTQAVSFNGQTVTLDSAGVTTLSSTSSTAFSLVPGTKTGTPNTTGKGLNFVQTTFTDSNTAGSGTAAFFCWFAIQQPTLAASNTSVTTTDAATVYIADAPAAGTNETITNSWALWVNSGAVRFGGNLNVVGKLTLTGSPNGTLAFGGLIHGLTYANNGSDATNDIDIAIGGAADGGTTATAREYMLLTTALTKRSDATWVVGTNQGMLDTGAIGDNDYYLWLIKRPDTGVVDVLCSLSNTAPTMPTNYTLKRLFGWFKRTGGSIVAFKTYELEGGGLEFMWTTPTLDINLAATLTTARRTDAVKVPLNFSVIAFMRFITDDAAIHTEIFTCPDEADVAPSTTIAPLLTHRAAAGSICGSTIRIRTSSTGTIAARSLVTVDQYQAVTIGFSWSRR